MFATLQEKAILAAVLALAIIGCLGWIEHLGYARCVRQDVKIVQQAQVQNAATVARATQITHEEARTYAAAIAAPVVAPVHLTFRVCEPAGAGSLPEAATAGSDAHGAGDVPGSDHAGALPGAAGGGRDVGPGLQKVGQSADAQVAGLQDYIRRVCLPR